MGAEKMRELPGVERTHFPFTTYTYMLLLTYSGMLL